MKIDLSTYYRKIRFGKKLGSSVQSQAGKGKDDDTMVIQGNEGMELGHNSRPLSSSFSFFAPFIRFLTQHIGVWLKNQKVTARVFRPRSPISQ